MRRSHLQSSDCADDDTLLSAQEGRPGVAPREAPPSHGSSFARPPASCKSDQSFPLQKYERFGRLEEASELWAKLVKQRPHSYATHYGYADFETRLGSPQKAFEIYKDGCSQKGLDYPEYLLEAWLVFVRQNGAFGDFEYTLQRVKKQKKGLEGKRARVGSRPRCAVWGRS